MTDEDLCNQALTAYKNKAPKLVSPLPAEVVEVGEDVYVVLRSGGTTRAVYQVMGKPGQVQTFLPRMPGNYPVSLDIA